MTAPIWQPKNIAATKLAEFAAKVGKHADNYPELWQWSVDQNAEFWSEVWDFCGVIGDKGTRWLEHGDDMLKARFFPEARLNFAENLLRHRDDEDAIIFWGENKVKQRFSRRELYDEVSRCAQALKAAGVGVGDRVSGMMPNMPQTIIAALAAASLGAIWSSCSPDFGVEGAQDRFGQVEPKILFVPDGYFYNGKIIDIHDKVSALAKSLPSVQTIIVVPYTNAGKIEGFNAPTWDEFLAPFPADKIDFVRLPFSQPLYILFSSGTTGKPKCIVHSAGGTLLQHLKEHQLHADIHAGDRLFYFTTCGWMMWNWLVSGLASDATLLLFDGSPFAAKGSILWDFAEKEACTHFGTSAKYLDAANKMGLKPAQHYDLSKLRAIFSTGSPLVPESYDYVYRDIKADLNLASISGGTDIVSCFALGSAVLPVYRGELQCRGLGMAVDIVDENAKSLVGHKGELICRKAFPSMPVGFWNDPEHQRYRAAYFERFDNLWCHGDFAELTERGGIIIYGRSDAVLNPGGVRIGTAEIYRQVEQIDDILESLACGQRWEGDERVILFVHLRDGVMLDAALEQKIVQQIRTGASPRHVPAKIIQVPAIPKTTSGKIVELAVKNVIHNEAVQNLGALANPEALAHFKDLPALQK